MKKAMVLAFIAVILVGTAGTAASKETILDKINKFFIRPPKVKEVKPLPPKSITKGGVTLTVQMLDRYQLRDMIAPFIYRPWTGWYGTPRRPDMRFGYDAEAGRTYENYARDDSRLIADQEYYYLTGLIYGMSYYPGPMLDIAPELRYPREVIPTNPFLDTITGRAIGWAFSIEIENKENDRVTADLSTAILIEGANQHSPMDYEDLMRWAVRESGYSRITTLGYYGFYGATTMSPALNDFVRKGTPGVVRVFKGAKEKRVVCFKPVLKYGQPVRIVIPDVTVRNGERIRVMDLEVDLTDVVKEFMAREMPAPPKKECPFLKAIKEITKKR
jgi:hypothetical protein